MPLSDDDLAKLADYTFEQLCAFCYDEPERGVYEPLTAEIAANRETLYKWICEQLGLDPFPNNPYRELFAFQPEDADYFFGREPFTQQLVEAVESRRLVAVLGASGSGKSSVVLAGLVPRLLEIGQWQYVVIRLKSDPLANFVQTIVPLYETDETKQIIASVELTDVLREKRSLIPSLVEQVFDRIQKKVPNRRLLIIIDQFEELYTYRENVEIRQQFLDVLLAAISTADEVTPRFILTLRADFLGQASLYSPFAALLDQSISLLGPMTREQLRDAIEKPASLEGVAFEVSLVERLLDDVGKTEGSIPLLEFALTKLWEQQEGKQLTLAAYERIGRVEGALSQHADTVYEALSSAEQTQARRVFVQLVNPGAGTEDTRRLATRTELERDWELTAKLADKRLIVTNQTEDAQEPVETVEVVHEVLIRNWGQ